MAGPLQCADNPVGRSALDDALGGKELERLRDGFRDFELIGTEFEFRVRRLFVRIVDAGEALDLAGAGLLVEALGVALFGDLERAVLT